jgi:hypothetical protein
MNRATELIVHILMINFDGARWQGLNGCGQSTGLSWGKVTNGFVRDVNGSFKKALRKNGLVSAHVGLRAGRGVLSDCACFQFLENR